MSIIIFQRLYLIELFNNDNLVYINFFLLYIYRQLTKQYQPLPNMIQKSGIGTAVDLRNVEGTAERSEPGPEKKGALNSSRTCQCGSRPT